MNVPVLEKAGLFIGGGGILAQSIPFVPDDLKSWPIAAICGLIAITAMALKTYETRLHSKAIESMSERMGTMSNCLAVSVEQNSERSQRQDETNSKIGALVTQISNQNEQLKGIRTDLYKRPCISGVRDEQKNVHIR